ncbi:MFS transporter [Streptomyces sp. NPDC057638]|uniref:MFS transporter n=1 Tax=Streptomyces sp. NPDC057638 TaxID=3346190 RepID=UPI0036CC9011
MSVVTEPSSPPAPSPPGPARLDARGWALLLVLCGAIFLEGIDIAMLAVAIPVIKADLGLSTGTAAWVVSGYVLGYAGFTLLGGRAADLLGRRRMFLAWMGVFLAFSALGGLATEGWMLVVSRFVTGVASAFMTPASMSIITTSYPEGPQRNKALLIFAGTAAGGFSLGLVIGGLLTQLGWRWVFYAPVLLAALILIAAVRLVPATDPSASPQASPGGAPSALPTTGMRGFDLPGAMAAAGAMLLLAYGVIRLEHGFEGWGWTLAALGSGALLVALFTAIERRAATPLVRLGILRNRPMVRADLGALLLLGSFMGFQFMVTLYLQELRDWSSLKTSLALLLMGMDVILAPTLTPWLVHRFGHRRVILWGFVSAFLGYALFLRVGADWTYAAMLPTLVLTGLAFTLAYGPLTIAATEGVDAAEQGLAGGLLYTATQFGAAIGVASVTAVYGLAGPGLDGFRAGLVIPVVLAAAGLLLMVDRRRTA